MARRLFERWQAELATQPRLKWAGVLLAAGELLCVGRLAQVRADLMLARGAQALCWPMWPGCDSWRLFDPRTLAAALVLIALSSVATALAFLRRPRIALPLLLLTQLLMLAFSAEDFRLRQNQFYILSIVVFAFVLVPERARLLRYLVVLIYFWAGLLKLNREWLSGAALYKPIWLLDGFFLKAACAWVVLLELVFVFGLLAKKRLFFFAALSQLVLFAIVSVPVVGGFYPLLMIILLAACAVVRREGEPPLLFFPRERASTIAVITLFCALQMVPRIFPGDTAITGEGRLFALHMFDAKVICESQVILREGARVAQSFDARAGMPVRTACDPAVLYARGRTLCTKLGNDPRFTIELSLKSRRNSDTNLHTVVELLDFCHAMPPYTWWRHNDWIRTG